MNSYKYYAVKCGKTKGIYFNEEDAQKQNLLLAIESNKNALNAKLTFYYYI